MKQRLTEEFINAVLPFVDRRNIDDIKMKTAMILSKYSIAEESTELTVYKGDVNDKMLKRFLMAKAAAGLSQRTLRYYRISITFFFNRINKPYCDINADDIRMYIATRTQIDKVSKVTADNERRNISSFYTWLQKEEILLKNPMTKVDSIKIPKKKKMAFTQMDIEKMRYACQNTFQTALFEILLSTWARVSEVAQIKISEIDIEKGAVLVHGKGDKERTVYLNAKAKLAVENYLMDREDDNPYLFPKCEYAGDVTRLCHGIPRKLQGEWYKKKQFVSKEARHRDGSTIESDIRRIGKRAGVENAHPHRFRRTGATQALRNGMPLITVSKLLGHENIGTTQIYLDISDKELEQAHEKYVI